MRKRNRAVFHFANLLLLVFGTQASLAHETEWLKQFGTPGFDSGTAIARHSTGVYVTGYQNPLAAQNPFGQTGFLRKYDFSGNEGWAREFDYFGNQGTLPFGIAVDDSGVYVAGSADRAFVQKVTHSGQPEWTHFFQLGDPGVSMGIVWAIAVHSTGVYVAGTSHGVCDDVGNCFSNALVSRLDLAGNELWMKIAGRPFDHPIFGYREDAEADRHRCRRDGSLCHRRTGDGGYAAVRLQWQSDRQLRDGNALGCGCGSGRFGGVRRRTALPASMSVRRRRTQVSPKRRGALDARVA